VHPFFCIFVSVMTLYLTGSPTRFGEPCFTEDNGFLADVKASLAAQGAPCERRPSRPVLFFVLILIIFVFERLSWLSEGSYCSCCPLL